MNDPFATLGLEPTFDLDLTEVERRYRDLSRVLHPDRNVGKPATERRMALGKAVEIGEAWRVLRDPIRRAEALFRRAGIELQEGSEPKASPDLLMEMMEQREALAEARGARDRAAVQRLAGTIRARETSTLARLSAGFAKAPAGTSNTSGASNAAGTSADVARLRALVPVLGELRYFRRFLDEVSAIEDDLAESDASQAGDEPGAAGKGDHVPV